MVLNQRNEELEEETVNTKTKQKEVEEAYEALLKDMGEKDKINDEMLNENVGLRLQLEQFIPKMGKREP